MTNSLSVALLLAILMCAFRGTSTAQTNNATPPPAAVPGPAATAQQPASTGLVNGGLEGAPGDKQPTGWGFSSRTGATMALDPVGPKQGETSACVDTTFGEVKGQQFSGLSQSIPAKDWQGKRVRYRAAVRVGELRAGSSVQLWMRVDQPKDAQGSVAPSAFDNMGDRPIKNETWQHHEIVLDVAKDADVIVLGMFVVGRGKAWLDDVTIEVVGKEVATTGSDVGRRASATQLDPRVRKAFAAADKAPQQPFFSWWLVLPAIGIAMFVCAMGPLRRAPGLEPGVPPALLQPSFVRWFALDFTIVYWLLYCLPRPIADVLSRLGGLMQSYEELESTKIAGTQLVEVSAWLREQFAAGRTWLVETTAQSWFGIARDDLVPPNGSGDTTYNYVANLDMFALALLGAILLALVRVFVRYRPARFETWVDLLRSFLRYVLAFYMLGYGLAKTGMASNQFPVIGDWQLDKTWGDSSPMNVLWSFMGASRPYTIFGGLCEVLAGLLLVWRRTSMLGALVALAVMTNVMMLNYCYDVPVKLLSSHLVIMALMICMPDLWRLTQVFVLGRDQLGTGVPSVWTGAPLRWVRRVVKALVIVAAVGWPIVENVKETLDAMEKRRQAESPEGAQAESEHLLVRRGYRWINEVPFNR